MELESEVIGVYHRQWAFNEIEDKIFLAQTNRKFLHLFSNIYIYISASSIIKMDLKKNWVPVALLVSFNLLYFAAFVLNVSPLAVAANLITTIIAMGGVLHFINIVPAAANDPESVYEIISPEIITRNLQCVYTEVNKICNTIRAIILWIDPLMSVYAMMTVYTIGMVGRILPTMFIIYILGWITFVAFFFKEAYYTHVHKYIMPYINQASGLVYNCYYSIPRFSDLHVL
ncbi:hypothetical protein BdWA1_002061 [Babesia duncani]|uniref:Reticulon-like protein n=1 Tax=Babesia duncani TaxID=323732 RepID=A0AAD9UPE8_9APIC|nr:hypothetical protein BdWA1_002061 [Babesia duncani]